MMDVPRLDELVQAYAARREALDKYGVYFLRDIDDQEAERFAKSLYVMAAERKGFPNATLTVYINSGGGAVGAGFAMMEMMYKVKRDFGVKINTVVTGYAYSMGAIVFQAGDHRSMGHFSTLMLHGGVWLVTGEDQKVFKDYEKLASRYRQVVSELFAKRTGKHTARWWTKFIYAGRDRFLSPKECLELGLTDEICVFDSCYPELPAPAR